jgi:hypothetical protein
MEKMQENMMLLAATHCVVENAFKCTANIKVL